MTEKEIKYKFAYLQSRVVWHLLTEHFAKSGCKMCEYYNRKLEFYEEEENEKE